MQMEYEAIYYINDINRINSLELSDMFSTFLCKDDVILFSIIEDNIKFESEKTKQFLKRSKYYSGGDWVFPHARPTFLEHNNIFWYRTINAESIQLALSLDSLFRCIVLSDGDSVDNARYTFYVIETDDSQVLCIAVKKNEDFLERVLPKIQKRNKFIQFLEAL